MKIKEKIKLMGQKVIVHNILERHKIFNGEVTWKSVECKPIAGWIARFSRVAEGIHRQPSWDEPGYLTKVTYKPVVLVSTWPTTKPIKVPFDGFSIADSDAFNLTSPYAWKSSWEEARKVQSEIASNIPRDAHGRFI